MRAYEPGAMQETRRLPRPRAELTSRSMTRASTTCAILVALLAMLATACAPRMQGTHFDRWAQSDAERQAEDEAEDKAEAEKAAGKTTAPVPAAAATKTTSTDDYTSPSASGTTTSRTSTGSRVIQPVEEEPDDDDVIY